ncbi:WD40 repeat-like protein [Trichoderma citrinoviride]|uniref:WD40 repeat-like protein n=1 Tax=Trichoderma citrinoviride TaxID=58853 RepID=A0A2T4BLN7_9HYPO|nr:WD40 repeat-like protein [Trichoderma citrinoviride]PTB70223.1 WD40 repeat-like protein [Trichoderma citrinoviride]
MDEDDQSRASSPTSDRDNEPDEVMDDADVEGDREEDGEREDEGDGDNGDEQAADGGDDNGDDADGENTTVVVAADEAQATDNLGADGDDRVRGKQPASPSTHSDTLELDQLPSLYRTWRPKIRPEVYTARLYDIVPTMAAPMSTSINAMAITPDLRYWITGGADGYIRKYDGPGTINGKLPLTVAQRHPFVDSVTKAGILMSYWPNEEPAAPGRSDQEHVLSSVYSLAVHSEALWLLSGLESGAINLQSVRHDEGKRICSLQKHTNAVSVLTLAPNERSVLSGSWDKNIFDWDLDTGHIKRSFDGSGGQISSIELRPASGAPVPADADEPLPSSTISTNNGAPIAGASFTGSANIRSPNGLDKSITVATRDETDAAAAASPAHESLFGGSDDAGSLFGETAGEQPFGHDDDEFGGGMNMAGSNEAGMDHSADKAMENMGRMEADKELKQSDPADDAMDVDVSMSISGPAPASESTQSLQQQAQSLEGESTAEASSERLGTKRPRSPMIVSSQPPPTQFDPTQVSQTTFLSSAIDGTIRIWDRRVPSAVARIPNRVGVPPWCMSACWSPDGNKIYAGRRNGTVEEFDIAKAKRGWQPERVLRFPAGSGAVSAIKPMVNGRHLVCASHDILRLYDLRESRAFKHSTVPFLIIPGPPRAGVISSLYIDPTSRFMLSAAGNRGWEGTNTEVLIGYEIHVVSGA